MTNTTIKHIFYLDDDPEDLELFAETLHEVFPAVRVSTARKSEHLLQALRSVPMPDVILLDINMPLMNGFDCLKAIRNYRMYDTVPVVIYASSKRLVEVEESIRYGADYFVQKGSNIAATIDFIHDLCCGKLAPLEKTQH
jgi:CheY-like chemotaxis protein